MYNQIRANTNTPYNWMIFLSQRSNKKQVVNFLCNYFVSEGKHLLSIGHRLIVSGGFKTPDDAHISMHVSDEIIR